MKNNGLFLVFEGVDGVGKTTQIKHLYNAVLARFPHCVTLTREPGGTKEAENIRSLLFNKNLSFSNTSNLLLFNVARAENIKQNIKPSLESGKIVICDRFVLSTLAYQSALHEVKQDTVLNLHNIAHNGFMPDVTIILYTDDIDKIYSRICSRRSKENSNTFDAFDKETYSKINNIYKNYYEKNKENGSLILINIDNKDIETIHCEIVDKLDELKCLDLAPCLNMV